jgi:hypothetical protein
MPPLPTSLSTDGNFVVPDDAPPLADDGPEDDDDTTDVGLPHRPFWVTDTERWAYACRVARRMFRGGDPDQVALIARHLYESDIPS